MFWTCKLPSTSLEAMVVIGVEWNGSSKYQIGAAHWIILLWFSPYRCNSPLEMDAEKDILGQLKEADKQFQQAAGFVKGPPNSQVTNLVSLATSLLIGALQVYTMSLNRALQHTLFMTLLTVLWEPVNRKNLFNFLSCSWLQAATFNWVVSLRIFTFLAGILVSILITGTLEIFKLLAGLNGTPRAGASGVLVWQLPCHSTHRRKRPP